MEELSKLLSHALRHEPWLYELELDDEGWAPLDVVLAAVREERIEWQDLSKADLIGFVESSSKRRHEIIGDRIRALYGHSVPGRLVRVSAAPPALLFHGTSPDATKMIIEDGLRPMARQYVHLSVDATTAREVGLRKSRDPVLIEVDAGAAHAAGTPFYQGNEKVWLADSVPPRFIRIMS